MLTSRHLTSIWGEAPSALSHLPEPSWCPEGLLGEDASTFSSVSHELSLPVFKMPLESALTLKGSPPFFLLESGSPEL